MKLGSLTLLLAVAISHPAGGSEPADRMILQCEPIETIIPLGWGPNLRGPDLAVVDSHIKPRRTRLILDGRAIGRAGDFDGRPTHLFLEPGRYQLRAELGGYGAAVFDIEARTDCLFRIRHTMQRIKGTEKEGSRDRDAGFERGRDTFSPQKPELPRRSTSGPDLSLRRDLQRNGVRHPSGNAVPRDGAALRFDVDPDEAAVYIDGELVASAGELEAMEQPLALASGPHIVEVIAPGHLPVMRRIRLQPGETLTIGTELKKPNTGQTGPNGS